MNKEYQIILAGNGANLNRGCDAITRGTIQIIRQESCAAKFVSVDFGNSTEFSLSDPGLTQHSISIARWSTSWFIQNGMRVLKMKNTWFPVLGKYIHNTDVVLAVGGDNYSMDYGSLRVHLALCDFVRAHNKPFIIWAGSLGPFNKRGTEYEKYVAEKLKRVTAILARENTTVEYLASIGIKDNVRRVVDPAFVMNAIPPQNGVIPFEIPANALGINFSSLMARYVTDGNLKDCIHLVAEIAQKLFDTFYRPVVLVPHSFRAPSNDYLFLNKVYKEINGKGFPIFLLPPTLNAAELKFVIGKLACFAGARMHSTIASLSSAVPTLSFSYSIKSVGLNRDIFGHDNYILSPGNITTKAVVEKVGILLEDEKKIRYHLEDQLPMLKEKAYKSGAYLRSILSTGTIY
jgi:colanic acid/amylovoran biosynthesis protein